MTVSDIIALVVGILGFASGVAAIINSNFRRFASERLYEREIEVLGNIYKHLLTVSTYSQLLTKRVFCEGENRDKYQTNLRDALKEAHKEFYDNVLYLPDDLIKQINNFFQKTLDMLDNFEMANDSAAIKGEDRSDCFKKAGEVAYAELPKLLLNITEQSRLVLTANKIPGFRKLKPAKISKDGNQTTSSSSEVSTKSDHEDKIIKYLEYIAHGILYGTFFAIAGLAYAFMTDKSYGAGTVVLALALGLFFLESVKIASISNHDKEPPKIPWRLIWQRITLWAGLYFVAVTLLNVIDNLFNKKSVPDIFILAAGPAGLILIIIGLVLLFRKKPK